jgi:nitrite reductase/ring-hydroxylating ferredoxin subunit
MQSPVKSLQRVMSRIESATALDRVAEVLEQAGAPIRSRQRLHSALTGRWLGHTLHPALVLVPAGCWAGAAILDASGPGSAAARRLVGAGVVAAGPAVLTGTAEWIDTGGAERRVGVAHALSNDVAVTAMTLSWLARRRGATWLCVGLAGVGLAAVGLGGYLGGHLAYVRGVAVNTTAFQSGPDRWQRIVRFDELTPGAATRVEVDSLEYVAVRRDDGVRVLENRCTHRGGPLNEGEVVDGCIECPWHGTRFRLDDGEVVVGPGAVPQPAYETRVVEGWVETRRQEFGALRVEPVGARRGLDDAEPGTAQLTR